MRLFTGISPSPAVLGNLQRVIEQLRPIVRLKWSPVENLHITTKFIGSWPDERLEEMKQALASLETLDPFEITIVGFGFLPNPRRPHVFFVGVQGGAQLPELARRIDEVLEGVGCAREKRPYSPHLTLARIKDENVRGLHERIASMTNFDFGTFPATEFRLYLSKPGPGGSVYSTLASFPLNTGHTA